VEPSWAVLLLLLLLVEFDIVVKVAAVVDIGAAVVEPTVAVVVVVALAFVEQKDPFESCAAVVAAEEGQRMDWTLPIDQLKRAEQQQQLLLLVEPKASWRLGVLELIAAVLIELAVAEPAAAVLTVVVLVAQAELVAALVAVAASAALAAEGDEIQTQPSEASAPQTGVMPLTPPASDILAAPHIAVAVVAVNDDVYQPPPDVGKPSLREMLRWNRNQSHRMDLMVGWMMPWLVLFR